MKDTQVNTSARNLKPLAIIFSLLVIFGVAFCQAQINLPTMERVVPNYGFTYNPLNVTITSLNSGDTRLYNNAINLEARAQRDIPVGSTIEWTAQSDEVPNPIVVGLAIMQQSSTMQTETPTLGFVPEHFGFYAADVLLTVTITEPNGNSGMQSVSIGLTYMN